MSLPSISQSSTLLCTSNRNPFCLSLSLDPITPFYPSVTFFLCFSSLFLPPLLPFFFLNTFSFLFHFHRFLHIPSFFVPLSFLFISFLQLLWHIFETQDVLQLLPHAIGFRVQMIKLLLICILRVLLSHSFIFFRFCFPINVYMVLFLFDNLIYVFLLLWLCILIVCLCMTTLTEGFPCFFFSCKANARVKPAKTGHGPHSS